MSKAEYTMDVYVVEKTAGAYEIEKILVNKKTDDEGNGADGKVDIGGNVGSNGFNFTNTYAQEVGTGSNPSTPDPTYNDNGALKVSKTVLQNVADTVALPNDKFDFTVKFDFPKGTDEKTLGGVKDEDGNGVTITKGETIFQLGNGENMKFTGLPVGTKITVTEAAKANYKASAKVTLNGVAQTPDVAASSTMHLLQQ